MIITGIEISYRNRSNLRRHVKLFIIFATTLCSTKQIGAQAKDVDNYSRNLCLTH